MRCCDVLLIAVSFQCVVEPREHFVGAVLLVNMVFVQGIHSVESNNHEVVTEMVSVVATGHPVGVDSFISGHRFVCRHGSEHNVPQVLIIFGGEFGFGRLVVIEHVIVSDDGQEKSIWEVMDDLEGDSLNQLLQGLPIYLRNRSADFCSDIMLAQVTQK